MFLKSAGLQISKLVQFSVSELLNFTVFMIQCLKIKTKPSDLSARTPVLAFFLSLPSDHDAATNGCFFLVASNADEHDDAFVGVSPATSNGAKYDARSDLATSSVKPSSGNVPASGNGDTHPVSVSVASCQWINSGSWRVVESGWSANGALCPRWRKSKRKTKRKKERQSF